MAELSDVKDEVKTETAIEDEDCNGKEQDNDTADIDGDDDDTSKSDRQVLVRNVDKKASSDDLEDFFFDNFENVEDIHRNTFIRGKGDNKKEVFRGSAVLTFTDAESANKFMEIDSVKYNGFHLNKISMVEANKRKEVFQKKKAEEDEKRRQELADLDNSIVICTGFHKNANSLQEVMHYMYDNHENVINVDMEMMRDNRGYQRWDSKTTIKFGDKRTADRFLGLTYVKFKGNYITRHSLAEFHKKEKRNEEAEAAKKKANEERVNDYLVKGASIKLTGFDNEDTKREEIKGKLVDSLNVDSHDIAYISFVKGDKEAIIRLKAAQADDVVKRWNEDKLEVGGDEITAEVLGGEEEERFLQKCKESMVNKMEKQKLYKRPRRAGFTPNRSSNWLEDY